MGLILPNPARDIALLRADLAAETLRNSVKDGWTIHAMVAGVADAFTDATGVLDLGSGGYDGAGCYLHNAGAVSESANAGPWLASNNGGWTAVDRSYALTNGNTVTHLKTYSVNPQSGTLMIVKRNSAGNFTVVASVAYSHPGGSVWQSYALASAYVVPGTGTYHVATYCATASPCTQTSGTVARALFNGAASGTFAAAEDTGGLIGPAGAVYFVPAVNVAMQGVVQAPGSAVTQVRMIALWQPVDVCTLGDMMLRVSGNGGDAPININAVDIGKFDGATRIVGGIATIRPATQLNWMWNTFGSKSQRLRGVWMQWR